MKLSEYDGKRIRLTTKDGEIYEGVCEYDNREYNCDSFGVDEEGLEMPGFVFYKSEVKRIEILPDGGPYGGYSGRYGLLEETAVRGGADMIEESLFSEETEHIARLVLCIEDHLALGEAGGLPPAEELLSIIRSAPPLDDADAVSQLERLTGILEKLVTQIH